MPSPIPEPNEYSQAPNLLPTPVEYLDFEKLPVEKPRPIIKNLFDDASRMIFGGGSKTYKSWCMCDLALSCACAHPWLEFETFFTPGIYVNFELKEYYFQRRLVAIRQAKGVKPQKDSLHVWNLRGFHLKLDQFKDELSSLIDKTNRRIAFIDPFYKLLGDRDERVSAELNPILSIFDDINRRTGCSIVAAAHFAKGNQAAKDPIERISGGGSLNRDPDNLVTLTTHENRGEFIIDFTLRDFPPLDPFTVKWTHPLLIRSGSDPSKIRRPAAGRPGFDPQDLLDLIGDNDDQLSTTQLQKLAQDELGWSSRTLFNKLSVLKREKKVFLSRVSQKWNAGSYSRTAKTA